MKIKVTQKHIDNGSATCTHCPIALAIRETHLPLGLSVEVTATLARFVPLDGEWVSSDQVLYRLPDEAQRFVSDFDRSKRPEPFEFEMGEAIDGI